MKKEDLVALGLDDTQVNEVFKIRGKEIEESKVLVSKLTLEKEAAEAAKVSAEALVEQVKKDAVLPQDIEVVNAEKKALEEQIKTLTDEHQSEISKINYEHTLDASLNSAGVKDVDYIKFKLNQDNLKFEDGKIDGLEDELSSLKESHAYLFADSSEPGKPMFTKKSEGSGGLITKESIMSIKDSSERIKAIQANVQLFD